MPVPAEPDLAVRLADALLAEKTAMAAKLLPFMRSDVIRVLRAGLIGEELPKPAKAKGTAKAGLLPDELWIATLEAEPHLAGIDIRKALAGAQFWCKNNSRQCTRKFFVNWLGKADRVVTAPGGSKATIKQDVYAEPPGWKESERARKAVYGSGVSRDTWQEMIRRGWFDLGVDTRAAILKAL